MRQTVVLLQTDVVDSTQLSERLGDDAMGAIWEAHDRLARDLLGVWRGKEIDRSDGFLSRFDAVADAAGFALDLHRGLGRLSQPLQVRAGIHVGPLRLRANSDADIRRGAKPLDVRGLAIPITARVMSLAKGGQTLLTSEAKASLGTTSHRVVCHGHWRLKGVEQPFEIYEIGETDAPFRPPPDTPKAYCVVRRNELWVPRREVRHNLPAERNAFVGRDDSLSRLAERFQDGARLISVVGPGGTGKTRLVQRFGWNWLGEFEGGVWFCDLSQATSLDGLLSAVAQGLDVPLGNTPPIEQLGAAIAGRGDCLVILDNFEQITTHAFETLGRWVDCAADARFLITTRAVLGLDGEEIISLAPMDVEEGIALFLLRARAAKRDFRLAETEREALHRLMILLDGLPLAIELAAARIRILDLQALIERMQRRFSVLTSNGGRPSRQATLKATLDWSWELLSDAERSVIRQLSVFDGGFRIEVCEAIVEPSVDGERLAGVDILQSLVDKSWIYLRDGRFGILGTVQEYAEDHLRLEMSEESINALQRRHWKYFARLSDSDATAGRCVEIDNLVAAVRRATDHSDATGATAALVKCWHVLKLCGPYGSAIELADGVRRLADLTPGEQALVEYVAGSAYQHAGLATDARRCFEAGVAIAAKSAARPQQALLLCALGEQETSTHAYDDARLHLDEAWAIGQPIDDTNLHCFILNASGGLAKNTERFDDAVSLYQRALVLAGQSGDLRWQGGLLGNLGVALHGQGQLQAARTHYEEALRIAEQTGDRRWVGNMRCNLGLLLHEAGDSTEGRRELEQALASARAMGRPRLQLAATWNLGLVLQKQGLSAVAREYYERGIGIATNLGDGPAITALRELTAKLETGKPVNAHA